jgi:hypothetical protein
MSDLPTNEQLSPSAASADRCERVLLDPRHPRLLDDREQVLEVKAGHVDVFAVDAGSPHDRRRHHLFRIEAGEIILDLQTACRGKRLQIVAVGGSGAELTRLPRARIASTDLIARWVTRLAQLVISPGFPGMVEELAVGEASEMQPGERRRGPMRSVGWARVVAGKANLIGLGPDFAPGDLPVPLIAGLWIEAGPAGCTMLADASTPELPVLWPAIDRFHLAIVAGLENGLARVAAEERQRLSQRSELTHTQTVESFHRLAETVVGTSALGQPALGQSALAQTELSHADPLFLSCRIVGAAVGAPVPFSNRSAAAGQAFRDVLEIARSARLRVRRVQLRDKWWTRDVGPLVAWHGAQGNAVALVRDRRAGYTMVDPGRGARQPVGASLAKDLAPEAAAFYPALPSRPLRYRDLLAVSMVGLSGSLVRTALLILAMGLLSLIPPLLTNFLVTSVIPRTEIDQLIVCARRDGRVNGRPADNAGIGDLEARRSRRFQAPGGPDRQAPQIAHRAVPQLHHGRSGRSCDGHRCGPQDRHGTHAARSDGISVQRLFRWPDALL